MWKVPLVTPSASHDASSNSITWPKKSWCTLFWSSRHDKCSVAIYDAIGITWCQPSGVMCPKTSSCTSFNHLDIRNVMLPLIMLSASHYISTHGTGIIIPKMSCCTSFQLSWPVECNDVISITLCQHQHQWHHMTKCYVAPHFDNLDVRNAVVWLVMLPASCDADASTSSITWSKKSYFTSFWLTWPRKWIVLLMMQSALSDADTGTSGITWPRKSCCTSFQLSWLKKCNGVLDDAVGIMWWWSKWCHMTKKCHIAYISIVHLRKTMLQFIMLLASCDTDTDPNGIMWHQHQWFHMVPMPLAVVSHSQKAMLHLILIVLT